MEGRELFLFLSLSFSHEETKWVFFSQDLWGASEVNIPYKEPRKNKELGSIGGVVYQKSCSTGEEKEKSKLVTFQYRPL